jgi:hypothetical protein
MNKITDINEYREDKLAEKKEWLNNEVMCLCGYRYVAVYHYQTPLKQFKCAKCSETGKIFKTGQDLNNNSGE